jgi:hypothetical protein
MKLKPYYDLTIPEMAVIVAVFFLLGRAAALLFRHAPAL